MIAFHGSPSNFTKLRIGKGMVRYKSSLQNEGQGIYFSTDIDIAMSYGEYLYKLEINDKYVRDFRSMAECIKYIREIQTYINKEYGVNIARYLDIRDLAEYLHEAKVGINSTCNEIYLLLDSNERWYNDISSSKMERIWATLRAYDKKHLKVYMFPYHIKNTGVCKTVDENIVRIIGKQRIS